MSAKKKKGPSIVIGRDAKTGQFVTVEETRRRPATTVLEKHRIGQRVLPRDPMPRPKPPRGKNK